MANELSSSTSMKDFSVELDEVIKQVLREKFKVTNQTYAFVYTCSYYAFVSYRNQSISRRVGNCKIVTQDPLARLYAQFKKGFEEQIDQLEQKGTNLADEHLITFYIDEWNGYQHSSKVLNNVFMAINKTLGRHDEGGKDINEIKQLSVVTWNDRFSCELNKLVTSAALKLIESERNGENIKSSLISDLITSYIEMGFNKDDSQANEQNLKVYKNSFETQFLINTEQYYSRESEMFLLENPVMEYVKHVEQRLNQEEARMKLYIHESTHISLASKCELVLIHKHFERFHIEFQKLLNSDKNDDLARMYIFMSRITDGLTDLKQVLYQHIYDQGQQAIEKIEMPVDNDLKKYVETIFKVHQKFNSLVTNEFCNDIGFVNALDTACSNFIHNNSVRVASKNESRLPELLAKYCDFLLKKSNRNLEEVELEDTLKHVMIVFKYISDKDVFHEFYSKMFAKRLVFRMSASDTAETSMISMLKQTCGFEYTNKLQGMFQDIVLSRDLNEKYESYMMENTQLTSKIDLSIQVLSSGSWPFMQSSHFPLPSELEQSMQCFSSFYANFYAKRKLNVLYNMCKGEIVTNCFHVSYILQTNTFQMAVLLQYNEQTKWTFQQLLDNTGISAENLQQILGILFKVKLLDCDVDENQLLPDTEVGLSTSFKNKKSRININFPRKFEQKVEQEITHKHIEDDREMLIQAAIVRIMKMYKQLKHTQLVTEVINQLSNRFNPKVQIIKKCIVILIEKKYLERMEGQKNIYSYMA